MEKDPINNLENNEAQIQTEYPSFEKHMTEMRNENNSMDISLNSLGVNTESTKTPEQRQVEDLEVLFSFCDEKDILDILKSDSYGILLENNVSLVDLFNADVLFNEQYYSNGYTQEFYERRYGNKLDNFTERRKHNIESKWHFVNHLEKEGNYDYAEKVRNDEAGYLEGDKIRAQEAKQTIADIAKLYFDNDSQSDKTSQFLAAVIKRSAGDPLSDGQKEFLKEEQNEIADRLLYGGKLINEDRANRILGALDKSEEAYERDKSSDNEYYRERADDSLVNRFIYAEASINDYIEAGRPELVSSATTKLKELVDRHFEKLANYHYDRNPNDYENRLSELILNYSDPFELIDRATKYELTREVDHDGNIRPRVIEADQIVEAFANALNDCGCDSTLNISGNSKALKALGASDEAILKNCHNLRPVDFISAESHYDGSGAKLIEAGVDKEKIIREVFSSTADHQKTSPFEPCGYPFKDESYVDTLERNGFNITDIAKTFSPDVISKNLKEFINRGANAKELMKYMASYREEFEQNIIRDSKGDISELHNMWFDGVQTMTIWDEDHPEGRIVEKRGMRGSGIDFIAVNLDTFAENGVTEEDIIKEISGNKTAPFEMFIPKMIECREFNAQKILNLSLNKYVDYLNKMEKAGYFDRQYVEMASSPSNYYSKIVEQISGHSKEDRDNYYQNLA